MEGGFIGGGVGKLEICGLSVSQVEVAPVESDFGVVVNNFDIFVADVVMCAIGFGPGQKIHTANILKAISLGASE